MLTIIHRFPLCISKQSKYLLFLVFTMGFCMILFYFGIPTSYKFFQSINHITNNVKSVDLDSNNRSFPILCVVARIYYAQISYLPVFALSLYHSHLHNIRIYLVNTDIRTDIQELNQTIQFINQLILRTDFLILLDLGKPSSKKDFGYEMTDRALTYLYEQHTNSPSICQFVTFTNADNFYSRNFAKKILPHMKAGKDIIAWGFISHHFKPEYQERIDSTNKTVPEIIDDGTEKCAPVELKTGFADLGAVAYRLSFLQEHKLYFWHTGKGYSFTSDGYFVEKAAKRTNASILLRQTLFVHQ